MAAGEIDRPRWITGGSDAWDQDPAASILLEDYFAGLAGGTALLVVAAPTVELLAAAPTVELLV